MTDVDPRLEHLIRTRLESEYEWLHRRPCPTYVGFSASERAECVRELTAWIPVFERAGWFDANGDDLPLVCDDCVCADCGGRNSQHEPGGLCSCGCNPACDRFIQDSDLTLLAEAVEPLVSSPMSEAVAHAAWHALNPSEEADL